MNSNLKIILLVGALLISGCQSNNDVEINSIKDALVILNSSKNYTLETENSVSGKVSYIYTENSIGVTMSRKASGFSAYIKDGVGIYPLSYEKGYKSGEYILNESGEKITDLYGGEVISTMYGVETEFVNSVSPSIKTLEITGKSYKMALLKTLGFSSSSYLDVESVKVACSNGGCNFVITISKKEYSYKLTNVNKSRIKEVDDFLASGGKVKDLSHELSEMRRLVRSNNFTRDIYDFSSESYSGIELFNPRYFYSRMNSSSTGNGAMAINSKANQYHSQDLLGCYYYQLTGDPNDIENSDIQFITTPMYEKPNIVEYYHYPTYLKILDDTQFIKEGKYSSTGYTYTGKPYYFDNQTYVVDFVKNFSIDQAFDMATYIPEAIGIDINLKDSDSESIVTFIYYFTYGHTYAMPIPLRDFGISNYAVLEAVADLYND